MIFASNSLFSRIFEIIPSALIRNSTTVIFRPHNLFSSLEGQYAYLSFHFLLFGTTKSDTFCFLLIAYDYLVRSAGLEWVICLEPKDLVDSRHFIFYKRFWFVPILVIYATRMQSLTKFPLYHLVYHVKLILVLIQSLIIYFILFLFLHSLILLYFLFDVVASLFFSPLLKAISFISYVKHHLDLPLIYFRFSFSHFFFMFESSSLFLKDFSSFFCSF